MGGRNLIGQIPYGDLFYTFILDEHTIYHSFFKMVFADVDIAITVHAQYIVQL